MKASIVLGSALLGLLVLAYRSPAERQRARSGSAALTRNAEGLEKPSRNERALPSAESSPDRATPMARREGSIPVAGSSPSAARNSLHAAHEHMFRYFTQQLELDQVQRDRVQAILLEREEEIGAYHAHIRRSRVLSERDYESWLANLRIRYYDRIGGLLNRAQFERFVALLPQGGQGDAVAFELEPDIMVVE
jgi:hypothetical protein